MQAITTKYLPATNTKPSRISAASESGLRVIISYDDAFDAQKNHAAAAAELCAKLNWHGQLASGATKAGYVFVFITGRDEFEV
jgi:hypothetical protein